jgi:2-phospho-L-lactate guanylyltransferase (CobY/MobA/RfbA family)
MARAPSSGGKTRLAPHLSAHRLRDLRRALLADTLRTVTSLPPPRDVIVFVEPGDASGEVEALSATPVSVPQADGDPVAGCSRGAH